MKRRKFLWLWVLLLCGGIGYVVYRVVKKRNKKKAAAAAAALAASSLTDAPINTPVTGEPVQTVKPLVYDAPVVDDVITPFVKPGLVSSITDQKIELV